TTNAIGAPLARARSDQPADVRGAGADAGRRARNRPSSTARTPTTKSATGPADLRVWLATMLESSSSETIARPIPIVVNSEPARNAASSFSVFQLRRATSTTANNAGHTAEASARRKTSPTVLRIV